MVTRINQPSFAGGIIGADMYARTDTTKYAVGLSDALNVLIRPQGGVQNRAGFRTASGFDTGTPNSTQWLIPFQVNTQLGCHLEFSENVFRVIASGEYVLDSAVTPQTIVAVSDANPAVIEMDSPAAAANFSVDELAYVEDPNGDHVLDTQVVRVTGVSNEFVSFEVFDWTTVDTSAADWGTIGAGATLSKVYEQTHPYAISDVPFVRFAQDVDDMYLVHPSYPVQLVSITALDDWALAPFTFQPSIDPPARPGNMPAAITGVTQADPAVMTVVGHGLLDGSTVFVSGVGGMTEINDRYFVVRNPTADTFELQSTGGVDEDSTGHGAYTSGGTIETFHIRELAAASGTDYRYVISALDIETLEESLPSAELTINSNLANQDVVLNWPAVADAGLYNVYRETEGGYGYIGTTASTVFTDVNIDPDATIAPKQARNPFDAVGDYPSIVSFAEQRLVLAATDNDPQRIEMSVTNGFSNFVVSYPSNADDALRFRLRTRDLNNIHGMVSGRALLMFTSSAEWTITGNENEGVLTPTSIVPRPETYWGSYNIEPVIVGEYVFFVEPSGNVVRDFLLNLNPNAENPSRDLTILVRDLFEDREITSWCYAKSPDRTVWVTLDDGTLLSLCYMAEHDIWGWTRQELGGDDAAVYQVSAVREGDRDVLYAVVGRTLGGKEVIMTERLDKRVDTSVQLSYYVDAGLSYDVPGTPVSVVSGLLTLRGQDVVALVDGNVVDGLTVDDRGVVDLQGNEGELIHIGLPYTAAIQTLSVDFEADGLGSMQGRFKAVGEVSLSVKNSRGLAAGIDTNSMNEILEWNPSFIGGPIPLFTGNYNITVDGDWRRNATVRVEQNYPLPMTVLGIAPNWETGE